MRYYKKIDGKLSPDDVESIVQRTIAEQALESNLSGISSGAANSVPPFQI